MKKALQKLRKPKQPQTKALSRITNETVEEHRQKVLAGGRKYKYPLQYSRHRLVFNTIIISVGALIIVALLGWWQFYKVQNTSEFAYRTALVLRLPVAEVDGEQARYSDYLLKLRGSLHYLREKYSTQLSAEDEARQIAYLKHKSMEEVIAAAYARKLAREHGITISDEEVERSLKEQKQTGGAGDEISDSAYYTAIRNFYDWSADEYLHTLRDDLLKKRVAYEVDTEAKQSSETVEQAVKAGGDTPWNELVAGQLAGVKGVEYANPGSVPKTNLDGGLARAASRLSPGEMTGMITTTTGTGYYIVRLISSTATEVNYEYIHIPLTAFQAQLDALYKNDGVKLYIDVPKEEERAA